MQQSQPFDKGGVPYRYTEISEQGGRVRRPTIMRAIEGLAAPIEPTAPPDPQQVDFAAMRASVEQRSRDDAC